MIDLLEVVFGCICLFGLVVVVLIVLLVFSFFVCFNVFGCGYCMVVIVTLWVCALVDFGVVVACYCVCF